MKKSEFIERERSLDVKTCTNQDVVQYIKQMQADRTGKGLHWDFRSHVPGWQITQVDQINQDVPVVYFTGELLFQNPEDFRVPSVENGDIFQVKDADEDTRMILLLDFRWKSEEQRVQFMAIGVAVNPQPGIKEPAVEEAKGEGPGPQLEKDGN